MIFFFPDIGMRGFNLTTGCFDLGGSFQVKEVLSTIDCLFMQRRKHKLRYNDHRDLNNPSVPKGRKDLKVQVVTAHYSHTVFPEHAWLVQNFITKKMKKKQGALMCLLVSVGKMIFDILRKQFSYVTE